MKGVYFREYERELELEEKKKFRWIFLIAIIFLIFPSIILINEKSLQSSYETTIGTCINYREVDKSDGPGVLYRPIYKYVVNNIEYNAESSVASSHPKTIGTTIKIYYNPEDPNQYIIDGENTWAMFGIIIMIVICADMFVAFPNLKVRYSSYD